MNPFPASVRAAMVHAQELARETGRDRVTPADVAAALAQLADPSGAAAAALARPAAAAPATTAGPTGHIPLAESTSLALKASELAAERGRPTAREVWRRMLLADAGHVRATLRARIGDDGLDALDRAVGTLR